jgi:hypothetical protein
MAEPTCEMELAPRGDGETAVAFRIRNAGSEPVELSWFEPFVTFAVEADVDGEPARIVRGAYDGGVRRVQATLESGEERRVPTPITLAFDPSPTLPDPGPPTRWRIAHEPAVTVLHATLELGPDHLSCVAELRPS